MKYLGTREGGGPKEHGSEGKAILQERKNNQERKLKHGTLCKEGGDASTKRNKISIVSWTRKSSGDLSKVYTDTFPIALAIKLVSA